MYGLMGGGIRPAGGGAIGFSITRNADAYALTLQNTQANGKMLQLLDVEGDDFLSARRISGNDVVGIGIDDASLPSTSRLFVYKNQTAGAGYVVGDFVIDTSVSSGDYGALRAVARQLTTGDSLIRGIEAHGLRGVDATASSTWGGEIAAHSGKVGNGTSQILGFYIGASSSGWLDKVARVIVTAGGSGYSNSFAVSFTGGAGTGAAGTATASGGVVQSVAITNPGSGYTSRPTPVFTAGGGTGATGVASMGFPGDCALYITDEDGWNYFLRGHDRDGALMASLDGSGNFVGGHLSPRASGTYWLGLTAPYLAVSSAFLINSDLGSAAAPAILCTGLTTTGLFWLTNGIGFSTDGVERMRIAADGSIGLFNTSSFGSGVKVLGIANAGTVPTTNPTGGGVLYATGGAGTWRGSSGTVTTFGPADPHCPDCGRDFAWEWRNEKYGHLAICAWCFTEGAERGIMRREQGSTA